MTDNERLERIKKLWEWDYPLTETEEGQLGRDVDWLINRVEELELELELEKSTNKDFEAHLLKQVESAKVQNERYKQALEYIQRAIYTQHCTKNHKWNTEFEKGQISGLIQASNIVDKAIRKVGDGID
jgi:hypothetical protein